MEFREDDAFRICEYEKRRQEEERSRRFGGRKTSTLESSHLRSFIVPSAYCRIKGENRIEWWLGIKLLLLGDNGQQDLLFSLTVELANTYNYVCVLERIVGTMAWQYLTGNGKGIHQETA